MDFRGMKAAGASKKQSLWLAATQRATRRARHWIRRNKAAVRSLAVVAGLGFAACVYWSERGGVDSSRPSAGPLLPKDDRPSLWSRAMATKHLCIIAEPGEAMEMGGKLAAHAAALAMALHPLYSRTTVLMAAEKCPMDSAPGPASTCHRRMEALLRGHEARGSPDQRQTAVEWLRPQSPRLDVSRPVAASLATFAWLRAASPACAAVHFVTPFLAAFAAAARRQWHALEGTSIAVQFSRAGPAALRANHQTPQTVEELEVDFMAAAAAADADAVLAASPRVAAEVRELVGLSIANSRRRGRALQVRIQALPTSAPALAAADSVAAAAKGAGLAEPEGTTAAAGIVFWGPMTIAGGLLRFCRAVDLVIKSCRGARSGGRRCPSSVRFVGADDGPLGDAVLHASAGFSGSENQQHGSRAALQHLERWGLPTAGAVLEHLEYEAQLTALHMPSRQTGLLEGAHPPQAVVIAAEAGSAGGTALAAECLAAGFRCVMLASVGKDLAGAEQQHATWEEPPTIKAAGARREASRLPPSSARAEPAAHLLDPVHDLAERIAGAISAPAHLSSPASVPSPGQPKVNQLLQEIHKSLPVGHPPPQGGVAPRDVLMGSRAPLVTVCLVHYNRPKMLLQAVTSLVRQTYPVMELVIVDNGSDVPVDADEALRGAEALWRKEKNQMVQVIRLAPSALGTARNEAARAASGKYLLFMDDDNYAKSNEVAILLRAAVATGAAAVACGDDYFDTADAPPETLLNGGVSAAAAGRWMPIGAAISVGLFRDGFGDANALFERSAFWDAGGFQAAPLDSTGEDWELFARLCLAGHDLQVVPEALFWYRRTPGSLSKTTSKALYWERTLQPYADATASIMQPGLLLSRSLAMGAALQDPGRDSAQPNAQEVLLSQLRRHKARCRLLDVAAGIHASSDTIEAELPPNLVQNPGFDRVLAVDSERADEWSFHGQGYSLTKVDPFCEDAPPAAEGADPIPCDRRLRLANPSRGGSEQTSGAHQVILVDQHAAAPLFVGGWSAAWDSGDASDDNYSLYIDIRYKDGSEAFGFNVPFQGGSHGMTSASAVIVPAKPVAMLSLYCLFRLRSGQVEFDNVVVRAVHPNEVCRALAAGSGGGDAAAFAEGQPQGPPPPLTFTQETLLLM